MNKSSTLLFIFSLCFLWVKSQGDTTTVLVTEPHQLLTTGPTEFFQLNRKTLKFSITYLKDGNIESYTPHQFLGYEMDKFSFVNGQWKKESVVFPEVTINHWPAEKDFQMWKFADSTYYLTGTKGVIYVRRLPFLAKSTDDGHSWHKTV